jgi:hypothetical protein
LSCRDRDGEAWLVAGIAIEASPDGDEPASRIARLATSEVVSGTSSWTGRWMLIGPGTVQVDAGALLPCFYRDIDGATWASTSSALVAEVPGTGPPPRVPRALERGRGITWYPPPHSGRVGVRRLLPRQRLTADGVVRTPLRPRTGVPSEETIERLRDLLVTPIERLQVPRRMWVSLTAGIDSRLVLAAAHAANRSFRTYTQVHPRITTPDYVQPPRIARKVGASHIRVPARHAIPSLGTEYDTHADGGIADADRGFYARRQWAFVSPGDTVLRGICFELGRVGDRHYFDQASTVPPPAEEIIAGRQGAATDDVVSAVEAWRRVLISESNGEEGPDWRDQWYLDQRIGGWVAAIEQSLDLVDGERFNIVNCEETYNALLSLPLEMRLTGEHHRALITRMAPALMDIPFNSTADRSPLARIVARVRIDPRAASRRLLPGERAARPSAR